MKNKVIDFLHTYTGMFVLVLMFAVLGVLAGRELAPVQEVEVVKYVEVVQKGNFDTSIIEQEWCGGFTDGTIRMVGAWWYADGVVEDEQGQLWGIDVPVSNEDFLLLWIADNNTPNNTTDDIIIKTWREAY
jgi:hypothetical protein